MSISHRHCRICTFWPQQNSYVLEYKKTAEQAIFLVTGDSTTTILRPSQSRLLWGTHCSKPCELFSFYMGVPTNTSKGLSYNPAELCAIPLYSGQMCPLGWYSVVSIFSNVTHIAKKFKNNEVKEINFVAIVNISCSNHIPRQLELFCLSVTLSLTLYFPQKFLWEPYPVCGQICFPVLTKAAYPVSSLSNLICVLNV